MFSNCNNNNCNILTIGTHRTIYILKYYYNFLKKFFFVFILQIQKKYIKINIPNKLIITLNSKKKAALGL